MCFNHTPVASRQCTCSHGTGCKGGFETLLIRRIVAPDPFLTPNSCFSCWGVVKHSFIHSFIECVVKSQSVKSLVSQSYYNTHTHTHTHMIFFVTLHFSDEDIKYLYTSINQSINQSIDRSIDSIPERYIHLGMVLKHNRKKEVEINNKLRYCSR